MSVEVYEFFTYVQLQKSSEQETTIREITNLLQTLDSKELSMVFNIIKEVARNKKEN
jgi:hypothetical protein